MQTIHRKKSRYNEIAVREEGSCRYLMFGSGRSSRQSGVDIKDPEKHLLNYSELMMSTLVFEPAPARVLIIGLGAGVVPTAMARHLPDSRIDVFELDEEVLNIAKDYFLFDEGDRIRVRIGDGRALAEKQLCCGESQYDITILDAFSTSYIPHHLMTTEFMTILKKLTTPHGVIAANIFNSHPLYNDQLRTLIDAFGKRIYELRGIRARTTSIVFAPCEKTKPLGREEEVIAQSLTASMDPGFNIRVPEQIVITPPISAAEIMRD